jgi:predicted alpha/beta-hydrolase family hydrolase
MAARNANIVVDATRSVTTTVVEPHGQTNGVVFAYAPGAGSNLHDPFGRYTCDALASKGFICVRMQFPFMEEKRRAPDRTSVLEATWRAVITDVRKLGSRLVVGGRSMGGRMASHVVSQGESVDGLALYAYPLHAPAKPDSWRRAHLSSVTAPTFFCSGTRDTFASPADLAQVARTMKRAAIHVLEEADHGYSVPAASSRTRHDVWQEAVDATLEWMREVGIV